MTAKKPNRRIEAGAARIEKDNRGAFLFRQAAQATKFAVKKTLAACAEAGCPVGRTTVYGWMYAKAIPRGPQAAVLAALWGIPPAAWGQRQEVSGGEP